MTCSKDRASGTSAGWHRGDYYRRPVPHGCSILFAGGCRSGQSVMWCCDCAKMRSMRYWSAICRFTTRIRPARSCSRVTSDTQQFSQVVTLAIDLMSQILLIDPAARLSVVVDVRLTLMVLALAPFIVMHRAGFPPDRPLHDHAVAARQCYGQRACSGDDQRYQRRQNLPAGTGDLSGIHWRQRAVILDQPATGVVFSGIFPILNCWPGSAQRRLVYFGGQTARRRH